MAFKKNGESMAERMKLLHELLAERLTGISVPHFVNAAMQHGLDFEDEAVDVLVERYPQYNVRLSHFYEHPVIDAYGATPDREVDPDGLLEVKCPTTTTFLRWVIDGVVPPEYMPQMTAQLLCTGRKWCGFVAYDPRIKDERRRLFVRKFVPSAEYMAEVEAAAVKFLDELDAAFDQFVSAAP